MRIVFPALVAAMFALLFIGFYSLSRPAREFDLPKPSRPNPLQVFTPTPAATLDMSSAPESTPAEQTESAVDAQAPPEVLTKVETTGQAAPEVTAKVEPSGHAPPEMLTKVEPAARTARAQAPPKKKRVAREYPRDDDTRNPIWWLWGLSDVHLRR